MKIYVASSWRNIYQAEVVRRLREPGFTVYDFKNPPNGSRGFHWSEIDPDYEEWSVNDYMLALRHASVENGFQSDYSAMWEADWCVLVLPCGRSSHLEAGFFCGRPGKGLVILLDGEPVLELMYKMADAICTDIDQLIEFLCDQSWRARHRLPADFLDPIQQSSRS